MTLILEAGLRTIAVAALAGIGLTAFRVRSSTIKLAAWRLVLYASLLMPLTTFMKPMVTPPAPVVRVLRLAVSSTTPPATQPLPSPIDWQTAALRAYILIAGLLLLRTTLGLVRLSHLRANATPLPELGADVFQAAPLTVPITCGLWRPRVLLPEDWHTWDEGTLDAVLAHERSHIAERDFLTQCLSKINRAAYWCNPLAWWLDRHLAVLAEHASDDAALRGFAVRPMYAAMLLGFAGRGNGLATAGVAMARHTSVSTRIDRILDEARLLSRPLSGPIRIALTSVALIAFLAIGACKMLTVSAQTAPPVPPQPTGAAAKASSERNRSLGSHRNQPEWVLVTPRGTSMSGSQGAAEAAKSLRAQTSGEYIWFKQDGKQYLIDDPETVQEIEGWFQPMEELGEAQGLLGEKQGALGDQMGKLGELMGRLGEQMSGVKMDLPDLKAQIRKLEQAATRFQKEASVNELSHLQSQLGELQALLGEAQGRAGDLQGKLGGEQAKLGDQQAKLGAEQAKLGEQQAKLGQEQARIAKQAGEKLQRLFEQALKDGRAKPVR